MSTGNTDNVNWMCAPLPELEGKLTDSIQVQITKFDKQLRQWQELLMRQAAEQEVRRLAEEATKKKAEEEARRVAEEKWRAEKQVKKVAKEKALANFEARRKAKAEVRAREKAPSLAVGEEMQAQLGAKPKVCEWLSLFDFTDLLLD